MSLLAEVLLPIFFSAWIASPTACSAFTVVSHLPGFDGPLPFYLETGYIEVDEFRDAHTFYYFLKSERKPAEDPVLVWLTGGPGCSGISGFFFEIGPLKFNVPAYTEGLPSFFYNPYTWTKVCNIIFLDSPVGTGFSYSSKGSYKTGDVESTRDVHTFIRKWFINHPDFLGNELYIGGDSYSGITVPVVAEEVDNGNQAGSEVFFNLKGYLVGNGLTDNQIDYLSRVPHAHGLGLISDELYEAAERSCGGEYLSPRNAKCANSLKSIDELLEGINYAHVLEPKCFYVSPKPNGVVTDRRRALKEYGDDLLLLKANLPLECRSSAYLLSYFWANNDTVREALQIRKGTVTHWQRCNYDIPYAEEITSTVKVHQNLTSRGLRALIYNGDHDLFIAHGGTQAWIRSLNSSIVDDWRPWSLHGQVAGYTRSYANNLTFATVKGGGHTAPEYNPKECQAMFERWMSNAPL